MRRTMKHGTVPRLWPSVLGLAGAACALGALITLLIVNPGKPPAVCRYSSRNVTVQITGPDCKPIMRTVTDNNDDGHVWVSAPDSRGSLYSQLRKGPDTVRVYQNGNAAFAGVMADFFTARHWVTVAPG